MPKKLICNLHLQRFTRLKTSVFGPSFILFATTVRNYSLLLSLSFLASGSSLCSQDLLARRKDGSIKSILEPLEGVLLSNTLTWANGALLSLLEGHTSTGATKDNVEIHTIDTNVRIVLDSKIDVLVDTETEVTGVVEVGFLFDKGRRVKWTYSELKFLNTEGTFKDVVGLLSTYGGEDRDVFVSSDTEGTDSVSGFLRSEKGQTNDTHLYRKLLLGQ